MISNKEEFEKALNYESWWVRQAAVESEHFEAKYMDIALGDEYWPVRLEAVESKHFEAKHMDIALGDEEWAVRRAAVRSKIFNIYCYIKNLDNLLYFTKV